MARFADTIEKLDENYATGLRWFAERRGQEGAWPSLGPDAEAHLATRAKGIYKPKYGDHALSVRQALDSPYFDFDVMPRADGTWSLFYFQEGERVEEFAKYFTNAALMRNKTDRIPVGVFEQIAADPNKYLIHGVAYVVGYERGYFHLEGCNSAGHAHVDDEYSDEARAVFQEILDERDAPPFPPPEEPADPERDARRRVLRQIVARQGQGRFRGRLLRAYESRCAITDCDTPETLEAAHIMPYRGEHTNEVTNGILLRADLHTLFDLNLLSIDPATGRVVISPALASTKYGELHGNVARLPRMEHSRPAKEALLHHLGNLRR